MFPETARDDLMGIEKSLRKKKQFQHCFLPKICKTKKIVTSHTHRTKIKNG